MIDDLQGRTLAAVVYAPGAGGYILLRVNTALLAGRSLDPVLSWARQQLASGMPGAWLLADELRGLT